MARMKKREEYNDTNIESRSFAPFIDLITP